jgi:hypothetical protein
MSPLTCKTTTPWYADDSYHLSSSKCKATALQILQTGLGSVEQWMTGSGLKVNLEKTELVIFHRFDSSLGQVKMGQNTITSKHQMNVLGIVFDNRLSWSNHVDKALTEAKKAIHPVKVIRKFFNEEELVKLITGLVYSRLYYGCQVCLIPTLKASLLNRLYSMSGCILRLINSNPSYKDLHKMYNRSTPYIFALYQTALNFYDLVHNKLPNADYVKLDQNTMTDRRNVKFIFIRSNNYKVGLNSIVNRLRSVSNLIDKTWIDMPRNSFKVLCKTNIIKNKLLEM